MKFLALINFGVMVLSSYSAFAAEDPSHGLQSNGTRGTATNIGGN